MSEYTIPQWLAFFYLYCLIGWIWESCYVSAKSHKWVNRGFLHGPLLPIYGSGALIILIITEPFKQNMVMIFFAGMVGATILEYITGYVMEKIFAVRYWDYTGKFMNINGYICLVSTICWGVFSVLMVKVFHPPVARLLLRIPDLVIYIGDIVISVAFIADIVTSTMEAIDLKKVIREQFEQSERLKKLQERLEVVGSIIDDLQEKAVEQKKEKELELQKIRQEIQNAKDAFEQKREKSQRHALRILKRNPGSVSRKFKENLESVKKRFEL